MDLSFVTADFLNDISWFDGVAYIILGLLTYICYKYINSKFK